MNKIYFLSKIIYLIYSLFNNDYIYYPLRNNLIIYQITPYNINYIYFKFIPFYIQLMVIYITL